MSETITPPFQSSRLIISLLREGVPVVFTAAGRSMRPFVRPGDRLSVDPAGAGALGRGDIGLYCYRDAHLVAHRCLGPLPRSAGPGLRFRGDAVVGPVELIPPGQVLGKVTGLERDGRAIPLDSPWRRLGVRLWLAGYPLRAAWEFPRRWLIGLAVLLHRRVHGSPTCHRAACRFASRRLDFRPATAAEAEAILRRHSPRHGLGFEQMYLPLGLPLAGAAGLTLEIAELGGALAGWSAWAWPIDSGNSAGVGGLGYLQVRQRFRRLGVGRAMAGRMAASLAAAGGKSLHLPVADGDAAAAAFCDQLGFDRPLPPGQKFSLPEHFHFRGCYLPAPPPNHPNPASLSES